MSEIRKRQQDEFDALKAIFCDDIKDCRFESSNTSDWNPVEMLVTVKPQSSEIHVSVDLFVNCGETYPETVPKEIQVKNANGISRSAINSLEASLIEVAKQNEGEEIVYKLIYEAMDFLNEHNKPRPKSFYDEMVSNQRLQEDREAIEKERKQELERRKQEVQRKILQEEVHRKKLILSRESRSRRDSAIGPEPVSTPRFADNAEHGQCNIQHEAESLTFVVYSNNKAEERCVRKTKCMCHNPYENFIDFFACDEDSSAMFIVSEWVVQWRHVNKGDTEAQMFFKEEARKYLKQFSFIEKFFKTSLIALNHENIATPLAVSFSIGYDFVVLRTLNKFVTGTRLSSLPFVMKGSPMDTSTIKKYGKEILEALHYLHSNSLTHGDLKDSNVFIEESGKINVYGSELEKRLSEFERTAVNIPMRFEHSDIYRFGLLLMWLSSAWKYKFNYLIAASRSELKKLLTTLNAGNDLMDLIEKCLNNDTKVKAETLLNHKFFKTKNGSENDVKEINRKHVETDESLKSSNQEDDKLTKTLLSGLLTSQLNSSRLSEFEVCSKLGSGGFGEVYKVKHILDDHHYALKKIPLNPSNRLFNKKIFFEVKYLSRLNHENVVRYYGAWIESEECNESEGSSTSATMTSLKDCKKEEKVIDKFVVRSNENEVDSSEDDDLSEGNIFGTSFLVSLKGRTKSFDDYVVFEDSNDRESSSETKDAESQVEVKSATHQRHPVQNIRKVMYIQMELCEKNTLRTAINSGNLCKDKSRRRQLFREIVEGLIHIHEHEIIHRDLKPGNIFLDSKDHVKIGDFGLATVAPLPIGGSGEEMSDVLNVDTLPEADKQKLTGLVGTPLYMAPELSLHTSDLKTSKIIYSQKVDIYSLGVILFEMCYPPPMTKMERQFILVNLRKPEIIFPENVENYLSEIEIKLLRSLLRHEPDQRPSSSSLLQSEYLPPPELEETEQQNAIRHVVSNPQSKSHKYLLNILFQRESSIVDDYVYDFNEENLKSTNIKKRPHSNINIRGYTFQVVRSSIESIMQRHSFIFLPVSTFMPKLSSKQYDSGDVFQLMDSNGGILSPPYDLRLPFARYVARNKILNIRRYDIQKVFRQRKMRYHPKELWECAFDIVTTQQSNVPIVPDADVLSILNDIIAEFPSLKSKVFVLRINHINFLKAILSYFDIPEDKHELAFRIISEGMSNNGKDVGEEGANYFIASKFLKENLTENNKVQNLINVLGLEKDSVAEVQSYIRSCLRKKQTAQLNALEKAKEALSELKQIIDLVANVPNFCLKVKISPSLIITRSNHHIYSGMVFQVDYEIGRRRKQTKVLAIGGRYDTLIERFRFDLTYDENELHHRVTAVGASIEIENILRYVIDDEYSLNQSALSAVDVVIWCSETVISPSILKEAYYICRNLRSSAIRTIVSTTDALRSMEELNSFCVENLVKYCLVVKENADSLKYIQCKIIAFDRERVVEKTTKLSNSDDILDYVKLLFKSENVGNIGLDTPLNRNDSNKSISWQSSGDGISTSNAPVSSYTNFHFMTFEDKRPLTLISKKRYISQMNSILSSTFNGMSTLEVIALDVPYKIVKAIACEIDFGEDEFANATKHVFEQSVKSVCDKHPRHRSYIAEVMQKIYSLKIEKKCPVVTLITYTDSPPKFVVFS